VLRARLNSGGLSIWGPVPPGPRVEPPLAAIGRSVVFARWRQLRTPSNGLHRSLNSQTASPSLRQFSRHTGVGNIIDRQTNALTMPMGRSVVLCRTYKRVAQSPLNTPLTESGPKSGGRIIQLLRITNTPRAFIRTELNCT